MPNSTREQLQRDAKKPGAFQAKVAYAQYLIEKSPENLPQAEACLREIIENKYAPVKYTALGNYWFAQLLQNQQGDPSRIKFYYEMFIELADNNLKESAIYPQACSTLQTLYQDNQVKVQYYGDLAKKVKVTPTKIKLTNKQTPELIYKELRLMMEHKQITLNTYGQGIAQLQHHDELTDTLKAKVLYQLIKINLQSAQNTGDKRFLDTAVECCKALTDDPKLNQTLKAEKADLITRILTSACKDMNHEVIAHFEQPRLQPRAGVAGFFISVVNTMDAVLNVKQRAIDAKQHISAKVKELATDLLTKPFAENTNRPLFEKKDFNFGNISDILSNQEALVKTTEPFGRMPYARAQERTVNLNTLTGNVIPVIVSPHATVESLKAVYHKNDRQKIDGITEDQQRLIFAGEQLEDHKKLTDYDIEDDATIHAFIRPRGDSV